MTTYIVIVDGINAAVTTNREAALTLVRALRKTKQEVKVQTMTMMDKAPSWAEIAAE